MWNDPYRRTLLAIALLSAGLHAQTPTPTQRAPAGTVIVPQSRAYRVASGPGAVRLQRVDAWVRILQRVATTALEVELLNTSSQPEEAELLVPVPPGAVVREFAYAGHSHDTEARLLERDEARSTYESIVGRLRDPGLLEFAGYSFIRTSVFPLEPGGTQKIRLVYENLLEAEGDRVDYVLPRSDRAGDGVVWRIQVGIKTGTPLQSVYSPTHSVRGERVSPDSYSVDVRTRTPGPFVLSYLARSEGIPGSFLAYPDASVGGGYFLFFAGLPEQLLGDGEQRTPRDVTIVIDRSGSMRGEKIEQAREAAQQVIGGLGDDDTFQVIDYADDVAMLASAALDTSRGSKQRARTYLDRIVATGGTNLHCALLTALEQPARAQALPLVLFLTDGRPTVGTTVELTIRRDAERANAHRRRVFTFGVGNDVNAPLLDEVARKSRGVSTYVQPKEDVEVKVGQVYRKLTGPVFADPRLEVFAADGSPVGDLELRELLPADLPDLFAGDQLHVLGMYSGKAPLRFRLSGRMGGSERGFDHVFDPAAASARHDFVPRLWADRKIAALIDEVRQAGAGTPTTADDPRHDELVKEIVALSTEFGILTEYTSFLAEEGTDLTRPVALRQRTRQELTSRAQRTRSGRHAVSQAMNLGEQRQRQRVDRSGTFLDAQMRRVSVPNVTTVGNRTFFRRDERWIDTHVIREQVRRQQLDGGSPAVSSGARQRQAIASIDVQHADQVVAFGSEDYFALVRRLVELRSQGALALGGEIHLLIDDRIVVVQAP